MTLTSPRALVRVDTAVGAELDGSTVTMAYAHGPRVGAVDRFDAASPSAALAELARRVNPAIPVVVALATGRGAIRQLPVPMVPADRRRAVIDAVAERAAMTGISCARLGPPVPDGQEALTVIGCAAAEEVEPLLSGLDLQVVLAPLVLGTDGVYLAVRRAAAELTVVEQGLPRLSRALGCGGMDQLVMGPRRLAALLAGDPDKDAHQAADAYAADLAVETRDTLAFWRRAERIQYSSIHVVGAGAALPTVAGRLSEVGVAVTEPPGLGDVEDVDPTAFTAISAALAEPSALVGFPDREGASRRLAIARAARSGRRVVTTLVAGSVAVGAMLIPLGHGQVARRLARHRLAASRAALASLRPEAATYATVATAVGAWRSTAASEPDWARALASILGSAPTTSRVSSVSVDDTTTPGLVSVTVEVSGTLDDLRAWSALLESNLVVSKVGSASATAASYELSFSIRASALSAPRPFVSVP